MHRPWDTDDSETGTTYVGCLQTGVYKRSIDFSTEAVSDFEYVEPFEQNHHADEDYKIRLAVT